MKIAILGGGKEGQAVANYFGSRGELCTTFADFTESELAGFDLTEYDMVFRSPSVRPLGEWTSSTKYFFAHCPCPIIGVTGTKGKGTTSSLITSILEALGHKVWLVGNIGVPAITTLDKIIKDNFVVYELSSFQLWDMRQSPQVAVVLMIEPDHLNVHKDFTEYVSAKANIARWQDVTASCIFNVEDQQSREIAEQSKGQKLAYPLENAQLAQALNSLSIVGRHNRENAEAAVLAVAAALGLSLQELLTRHFAELCQGLANFHGLPHRLEFLRELKGVKYYDDNFSTNIASTKVAVEAFRQDALVLIVGGRDKTNNVALSELYTLLQSPQVKKVVLLGELGHELAKRYKDARFVLTESLEEAVQAARTAAEQLPRAVVLMSPAAASFDMFENVYDRGEQYQTAVRELK